MVPLSYLPSWYSKMIFSNCFVTIGIKSFLLSVNHLNIQHFFRSGYFQRLVKLFTYLKFIAKIRNLWTLGSSLYLLCLAPASSWRALMNFIEQRILDSSLYILGIIRAILFQKKSERNYMVACVIVNILFNLGGIGGVYF